MQQAAAEKIRDSLKGYWRERVSESQRPDTPHVMGRLETRALSAMRDLLPEKAVATLIQLEEGDAPEVLAVDGQQVYLLAFNGVENVDSEITVELRSMHIDPKSAVVKLETELGEGLDEGPVPRSDVWRFTLPDETQIILKARFSPGGKLKSDEAVALELASAFGVDVPAGQPPTEPLVAHGS